MFNILLLSLQIRFTLSANRLINFLKHIPLIKRIIPNRIYGEYSLKTLFAVFGAFSVAVKKIFIKLFYAALLTGMGILFCQVTAAGGIEAFFASENPFAVMNIENIVNNILTVWFILSFAGGLTGAVTITAFNHEGDSVMISQLRADPARYAKSRIFFKPILDAVLYLPYLLLAFVAGGFPVWAVPVISLMYLAFRWITEAFNLFLFRCTGLHFGRLPLSLAGLIIYAASVYFPLYTGALPWKLILTNPLTALLCGAACAGAWFYISKYSRYAEIIRERIARTDEILLKSKNKANTRKNQGGGVGLNFVDAQKWSKNINEEDLHSQKHEKKTGFAFLNAIFFDRHDKYFKKKIIQRCSVILIPLIAAAVFLCISLYKSGVFPAELIRSNSESFIGQKLLFNHSPIFFFIIYVASMGRVITASVFSNCDIQMLHYSYYRARENIFASFKSRISVILLYNFIISVLMAFSVLTCVWIIYGYLELLYAGIFFILMIIMGIFFAFNDLFLYYIIQPYDSAGQAKSTVYKVINGIIYMIAYVNLQTQFDFKIYAAVVIAATILYLFAGTGILFALAPKKFKLR